MRAVSSRLVFEAIVVGTDGSETASKALDAAIELAQRHDATLHVVSAFVPVSGQRPRGEDPDAAEDAGWAVNPREDVEATLGAAAEVLRRANLEVNTHAREGDPADAILDVAEETKADLIIVGNKGMTGARRFLLGSVPNKVSHHAPCSVLIIRTT